MSSPHPAPGLDLVQAALYDGTGRHVAGLLPPLVVNNVLTEAHNQAVAERPFYRMLNHQVFEQGGDNLGLVWMAPLGLAPNELPMEVMGALVQVVDRGFAVIVRSDRDDTVADASGMVLAFTGFRHGVGHV